MVDKHREGREPGEDRSVAPHVREEFLQLGGGGEEEEAIPGGGRSSSLRYLRAATTSGRLPTPAILHCLMVEHLLEQASPAVRLQAARFLHQFLFLQLGRSEVDRAAWQRLVLSSCRSVETTDQLESFDLASARDLRQCGVFLALVLSRLLEAPSPGSGPRLLATFLTCLLQRDLEAWWRQGRRREGRPLLYHMLEGESRLAATTRTTVVGLYRNTVGAGRDEPLARRLLAMAAMLVAHQDTRVRQAQLTCGGKVALAEQVAAALASLPGEDLRLELALMQPPWLALLVARHLVARESRARVDSVTALLAAVSLGSPAREHLAYRLVACRHLHTLATCSWAGGGLATWRGMARLGEHQVKETGHSVRWKSEVAVAKGELVEDVNTLLAIGGHRREVGEQEGSTRALLFKMSSPTQF